MITLAYSMAPSVYAPTQVHREPVTLDNALMVALETARSKCAEGLGTSTSSTLMHTKQRLMTGAVGPQCKTPTIKSGIQTWVIVSHGAHLSYCLLLLNTSFFAGGGSGGSGGSGGKKRGEGDCIQNYSYSRKKEGFQHHASFLTC